ncbi:MAG: hypothetical protein MZV63_16805 [Marinilabiliales bacterium]|nr:hypothetical protein [Marinilabiliales bacterium]
MDVSTAASASCRSSPSPRSGAARRHPPAHARAGHPAPRDCRTHRPAGAAAEPRATAAAEPPGGRDVYRGRRRGSW